MRKLSVLLAVLLFAALSAPARATVIQLLDLSYDNGVDPEIFDFRRTSDDFGSPLQDITGQINGGFGSAFGSIGVSGAFGVAAQQFAPGSINTTVQISNSRIDNPFTQSRRAESRFIIDGGGLGLTAGPGSSISFLLSIGSTVYDRDGTPVSAINWSSGIALTLSDIFGGGYAVAFTGADIGASDNGLAIVDIPLSFQTLDLGLIPGEGYLDLVYQLVIQSDVRLFAEGVGWHFSDPFSTSGPGPLSEIVFLENSTTIPEPASLTLLLTALAALGLRCLGPRCALNHV